MTRPSDRAHLYGFLAAPHAQRYRCRSPPGPLVEAALLVRGRIDEDARRPSHCSRSCTCCEPWVDRRATAAGRWCRPGRPVARRPGRLLRAASRRRSRAVDVALQAVADRHFRDADRRPARRRASRSCSPAARQRRSRDGRIAADVAAPPQLLDVCRRLDLNQLAALLGGPSCTSGPTPRLPISRPATAPRRSRCSARRRRKLGAMAAGQPSVQSYGGAGHGAIRLTDMLCAGPRPMRALRPRGLRRPPGQPQSVPRRIAAAAGARAGATAVGRTGGRLTNTVQARRRVRSARSSVSREHTRRGRRCPHGREARLTTGGAR